MKDPLSQKLKPATSLRDKWGRNKGLGLGKEWYDVLLKGSGKLFIFLMSKNLLIKVVVPKHYK